MNITLSHNTALTMDSTVITIEWIRLSYVDIIVYGLFGLLIFVGLMIALTKMRHGG
jgi:hypothetical protein